MSSRWWFRGCTAGVAAAALLLGIGGPAQSRTALPDMPVHVDGASVDDGSSIGGSSVGDGTSVDPARVVFHRMTRAQRVGQLFMVGTPATGLSDAARRAIRHYHVGSVILAGRSDAGVAATRQVSDRIQAHATRRATLGVRMLVATDQEGGYVQVLSGPGFSSIPTALTQGGWSTRILHHRAHVWGRQLREAGVNLDLAPVMDTVPAWLGTRNAPIGYWQREYGHTTRRVARHGRAFAAGLRSAHVQPTLKHFPGLGRVRRNTDTSSGVTDHRTTYSDPFLRPFKVGIRKGARFVMMSTAYYPKTGATRLAAFSSRIMRGMLRRECGFTGVIVSDSLAAIQVEAWRPGVRAVRFIRAGGDLALTTDPSLIPAMTHAVLTRLQHHPAFRRIVRRAVIRVLDAKVAMGLLPTATSR